MKSAYAVMTPTSILVGVYFFKVEFLWQDDGKRT
jgi:hypothetical protein